jgi:sialate O-acetylesterase
LKRYLVSWFVVLSFLIASVSSAYAEGLRLPAVIGDHMVLQRETPVAVWGWALAGQDVCVRFKGQEVNSRADSEGAWRVRLEPMDADAEPAVMTVTCGDEALKIQDVLVGEVWLCSGQSNMEFRVERVNRAAEEIVAADWPQIRHIETPYLPSMQPMDDAEASWAVCSSQTVMEFTAVGYFFGRMLHQELGVPIGLLNCTWGATRIEAWTPVEGFANVPELMELYHKVKSKQPDSDAYEAAARAYMQDIREWLDTSERQLVAEETLIEPGAFPGQLRPYTKQSHPTMLYNGMIHPFVPYTIKGSIWYQGEANRADGMMYLHKTRALLAGWREQWERPDLPYYFVQIAPFKYGTENPYYLPKLWEAQAAIEEQVDHTGMVVVNDIGNTEDIHPTNKQDVGARLADMALKREYGRDAIIDNGPRFKSMRVDGERLLVTFEHAGEGLSSRDGEALTWFEIVGEAEPWTEAEVEVVAPDMLAVTAAGIDRPVAVRFAWHKLAEPNLVNSVGLPAAPFRAGEPPNLGFLALNVPESEAYELIYELDLDKLDGEIVYETDNSVSFTEAFDRVAYYIELGDDDADERQWVYVSMDSFSNDLNKIGVPTFASKAHFQLDVENLVVYSNVRGVPNSEELSGNIEFWPNDCGKTNAANVIGATNAAYDTGDEMSNTRLDGYGSMQVHVANPSGTVFALNNWKSDTPDLGIGTNLKSGEPDWTFTKSADRYTFKQMKVLVRPVDR